LTIVSCLVLILANGIPRREQLPEINARDVEIDHLKTTVIALNEKVEAINDMRNDVGETRNQFDKSEQARV